MRVQGKPMRTIWPAPDGRAVQIIDQRALPHRLVVARLASVQDVQTAITDMWVRGAPLIGVSAAYGMALQALDDASDAALTEAAAYLKAARPTAVNLAWAVDRVQAELLAMALPRRAAAAWALAQRMADEDVAINTSIGHHGARLLHELRSRHARRLNVLTHCNAGWLATVDGGTALAPIYQAHDAGVALHVWVDETRPRNQGASLTAWELAEHGVPHTVVADNAGGHLMQRGEVDIVIVGCDRVTARGDVCNKIGTYLKALAAHDNGVPFLVAMPLSTLDLALQDGLRDVPIEQRSAREVTHISGRSADGASVEVQLVPDGSAAANPAFDVTPARLVTSLITEHGMVAAEAAALRRLCEAVPAMRRYAASEAQGRPAP
jgi:methylthioribose-1-phosphate isomerase